MITLKQARTRKGYNQKDLGRIVGMSQPLVSYIESGEHIPSKEERAAIALAVGVPEEELIMCTLEAVQMLEGRILSASTPEERQVTASMLREIFVKSA